MRENTKTENRKPNGRNRTLWLLLALVVVFIYFFGLTIPLVGPDEPRYAQVAREMFERSDWVTPTLGGFDWFEKPALLYWLQIFFYKTFGVGEFAARFGSALFGLGTIFSLWILGKSVDGQKQSNDDISATPTTKFSNWLALIAASSVGLLAFSRGASFDIILTFPVTAALVSFFIFDRSRRKTFTAQYLPLILFYFFIGVALLAKGLVGIVFPIAIVAFYYLLSRKTPPKTFIFSLFWGTILSLSVAASWYVPMYRANGWKFIDEFFIQHHFQRFTSDKYRHHQPFWFFFAVLPLMTIPWLPFFFAALWNFAKKNFKYRTAKEPQNKKELRIGNNELKLFALAWLLVPLVFFSLSGSKLPGYILPALPAALILTADYVYRFVYNSERRKTALQTLAFATLAIVFFLLEFVVPQYAARDSVKFLVEEANARGFANAKIVNLYTVSHNAEFYAAGRLIREPSGVLKRYDDFSVLINDLKNEDEREILVLVSSENVKEITKSDRADADVLGDNGEMALVLVKPKV